MAIEYRDLVEEARRLRESDLREENDWIGVTKTAKLLGLSKNHVQGNVLAAGIGLAFPERFLVGTLESKYRTLREEIQSLNLCDYNPELLNCTYLINHWLDCPPVIIPDLNGNFVEESVKYKFIRSDIKSFLASNQLLFDTIMIFCIFRIGKELADGLGVLVAEHLRPGGYVMGSGIFAEHTKPFLLDLEIEKLVELERSERIKNDGNMFLAFLAKKPA